MSNDAPYPWMLSRDPMDPDVCGIDMMSSTRFEAVAVS